MKFILMFFVIIGINIGLSDANAAEPGTKVWSDVAELSFVKTGGNTDVENLLINNALKYLFSSSVTGNWNLHILNGETNNTKTAEKYDTELRLDKKYSDRVYSFGNVIWLQDKFAGFSQSVEYIPSFKDQNNYFVNSETAVVSALNGYLSLKASYVVNYNNDPPAGKERTDTITSTTLVVNF